MAEEDTSIKIKIYNKISEKIISHSVLIGHGPYRELAILRHMGSTITS
jgi:hypothetical protein